MGKSSPSGKREAYLAVIGDMPTKWDAQYGRLFAGPGGKLLDCWWGKVGLDRSALWLGNVYEAREAKKEEILAAGEVLRARLAELPNLRVVVPLGQVAVQALLGLGIPSVTRCRGSIYECQLPGGRMVRAIPSLHPSMVLRIPGLAYACQEDWHKISLEQSCEKVLQEEIVSDITPTFLDVETWVEETLQSYGPCALDIETSKTEILCVGLSCEVGRALVVPMTTTSWPAVSIRTKVIGALSRLVRDHRWLVAHNGLFDFWWIAKEWHVRPLRGWWDTQGMAHALNPHGSRSLLPFSLHYLASIHTRHRYWKDDGKEAGVGKQEVRDWCGLLTYCGKDAAITLEIFEALRVRLRNEGLEDFYLAHYIQLMCPLLSLSSEGVLTDPGIREVALQARQEELERTHTKLQELAGRPLHVKTSLSGSKVAAWLYGDYKAGMLGAPKKFHRGTGKLTTDGLALKKLIAWSGEVLAGRCAKSTPKYLREKDRLRLIRETAKGVLRDRRIRSEMEYYTDARIDSTDQRLRCSYVFKTPTGVLATRENPLGRGANLQSMPRNAKGMLVADPGRVLLEIGFLQGENRLVMHLTGDARLSGLAQQPFVEYDPESRLAAALFGVEESGLTGKQVQVARYVTRASQYGMSAASLMDLLTLGNVWLAKDECERGLEMYFGRKPEVREWHAKVRRDVLQTGGLRNSWGRRVDLSQERFDERMWTFAYSWLPQSEIGDMLSQWGLIFFEREKRKRNWGSTAAIVTQDSLVINCRVDDICEIAGLLWKSLSRPREIGGLEYQARLRGRLGATWMDGNEFHDLPNSVTLYDQAELIVLGREV